MKILVIDNYDSFVYNLVHYIKEITSEKLEVYRNDKIKLEEVKKYDKILLSPGPGIPNEAGICLDVIKNYADSKSILGVCLGHQTIGEAFGGQLTNLEKVYHGIETPIHILKNDDPLFSEIPTDIRVGRYHSWVVSKNKLPDELEITAEDNNGMIMGLSHKNMDVRGVQFHPESVLTKEGMQMMKNWINL